MRILTVRQPWAWAIIHGGKDVENRVRNLAGDYRGPVAIHAGLAYDHSADSTVLDEAMHASEASPVTDARPWHAHNGVILGVVDLVDVHSDEGEQASCSPWAQRDVHHLVLENPRALTEPIPYPGALGLRTLDEATAIAVWEAIAS